MWCIGQDNIRNIDKYREYVQDGIRVLYRGLIFKEGFLEGEESIGDVVNGYLENGEIDFLSIFGAYHVVIIDVHKTIFFTDHSYQRIFVYNNKGFADNLGEGALHLSSKNFDDKGVAELLQYGQTFQGRTVVADLIETDPQNYYVYQGDSITAHKKDIGSLNNQEYGITPERFSKIMAYSLRNKIKAVSLTGGFDSRYVFSLMTAFDKKNVFTTISCTDFEHKDVTISKKVAEVAEIEYDPVLVEKPQVTEELLTTLFLSRNGSMSSVDESIYRLNTYLQTIRVAGGDMITTGDSGVFHKAEDWYQDFPRYSKPTCNIEGYYNKRLIGIKQDIGISQKLKDNVSDTKKYLMDYLQNNQQVINTKSYDWFHYYLTRGLFYDYMYNSQNEVLTSYAPLLEYRFVINSYNLPRKERSMARYMKKFMTVVNPKMAAVPTAIGVTASCEAKYKIRDQFLYMVDIGRAALRLAGKILFKKTLFSESISRWSFEDDIRGLELSKKALSFAKENGWLRDEITLASVNYGTLKKLVELYLLKTIYMKEEE